MYSNQRDRKGGKKQTQEINKEKIKFISEAKSEYNFKRVDSFNYLGVTSKEKQNYKNELLMCAKMYDRIIIWGHKISCKM